MLFLFSMYFVTDMLLSSSNINNEYLLLKVFNILQDKGILTVYLMVHTVHVF